MPYTLARHLESPGSAVVGQVVGELAQAPAAEKPVGRVGRVANIGVHGKPVTLHLDWLWTRDLTVTTALVHTYSTPTLVRLLASHLNDAHRFVAHASASTSSSRHLTCSPAPARPGRLRSSSADPAGPVAGPWVRRVRMHGPGHPVAGQRRPATRHRPGYGERIGVR